MKKTILSICIALAFIGIAQANEKTGDLKSSATMQATCSISANQIGFGAIAIPLLAQSANSEMTVKCSNASAYTIDLAYGGIYGESFVSNYTFEWASTGSGGSAYTMYDSNNVVVGKIGCLWNGTVNFSNPEIAKLYGSTNTDYNSFYSDRYNACNGATPKPFSIGQSYSYGVMNGLSKGDKLAYSIQVPHDANKVWNKGNNSFKATGNGDNQTIPLIAKIVPDKSGSKFPAPDMYLDTVTAVISY